MANTPGQDAGRRARTHTLLQGREVPSAGVEMAGEAPEPHPEGQALAPGILFRPL